MVFIHCDGICFAFLLTNRVFTSGMQLLNYAKDTRIVQCTYVLYKSIVFFFFFFNPFLLFHIGEELVFKTRDVKM